MVTLPIVEHAGVPLLVFMANAAALSLVACGAALAAARVRRAAPLPLRHAVLLTGLCLTAAGPLLIGAVAIAGRSVVTVASQRPIAADRAKPQAARQEQRGSRRPLHDNVQMIAAAEAAVAPAKAPLPELAAIATPFASPAPASSQSTGDRVLWAGFALLAPWIAGACWQLWRLAAGLARIRAFLATVESVQDQRIVEAARRAARAVGLRRLPTLGQSAAVDAPLSVGLLHGRIVLPTVAAAAWSDFELHSLLVHEMAHLRRRDLPVGLLQRITAAMFWWNPLLRRLNRSLSETREQICDDLVAQHMVETHGYARLLVELAARVAGPRFPVAALGAIDGSPSELGRRVRRLLDSRRRIVTALTPRTAALAMAFAAALFACLLAACVRLAPAHAAEAARASDPKADAKDEDVPPFEMSKKVRIVDGAGQPIVGAKVEPWAMRARNGHGSWSKKGMGASEPPKLTSDADGFATIPFPKYAMADGEIRPGALTVRVDHPDFVQSVYNDAHVMPGEVDKTTTITMEPGAVVQVAGLVNGEPLPITNVHAQWASPGHGGSGDTILTSGGMRRLPRLPAGRELIRLAYLPEGGEAMFSEIEKMDLAVGQDVKLRRELAPAARVQGRLDASVPRPVTGGVVIAEVIYRDPDDDGGNSLEWRVWSEVAEDGTFELPPAPRGELQVIALCDGFIAEAGTAPASDENPGRALGAHFNGPQVFTVASGVNVIEIPMTPTADCAFHVADPNGKPIAGARVGFWPNVAWWGGGSQIYAWPSYGTEELLTAEDAERDFDWTKQPFVAETDDEGNAVVKNLPETESRYVVTHDDWELWTDANRQQSGNVDLQAGKRSEVSLVMQPKGTMPPAPAPPAAAAAPAIAAAPLRPATHIPKPAPAEEMLTEAEETELAGVVVDEAGQPLADVKVDAWTWHPGNETTTNKVGRFRLAGFDAKEAIEVEFTKPGYVPSLYIDQKAGTQNWTIVLTKGTTLVGKVLDPAGEPVAGATVRASRGPFENPQGQIGEVWTEATTGDDGGYVLPLEPYVYDVQVRVPGVGVARREQVNVEAKRQMPLDIPLEKGVTLRANVRNSVTGEPVEGLVLWSWIQPGIEGTSNAEGVLEISGMMPGDFEFNVSATGVDRRTTSGAGEYGRWWSPQPQRAGEADRHGFQRNFDDLEFNLQGDVAEVQILVEPGVTITGRVIDPDGKPVAGVTVAPAKTGSGNSITGDTRYSYKTDDAGRFTMKLPASKSHAYNLIAHDGDYQTWRTWAAAVGQPLYTEPGEALDGVELRLARPATVRGRVVDDDGQPRSGAEVRAIGTDGLDNRYYVPTTKTDADGRYELKFVRPGEHRVQVEPFWLEPQAAPNPSTKTVAVEEGAEIDGVNLAAGEVEWLGR